MEWIRISKKEWNNNQKLNHDPRITRVGRILRKCSIDESPQFFSILIGNMRSNKWPYVVEVNGQYFPFSAEDTFI
jgi:hypothetical protein